MAIRVTSVQRANPAPCQHYRVTVDVDGREEVRAFHLDELKDETTDPVMLLVKRLVEGQRMTLEDLSGKILAEDVPREGVTSTRLLSVSPEGRVMRTARQIVSWWIG